MENDKNEQSKKQKYNNEFKWWDIKKRSQIQFQGKYLEKT